MSRLTRPKDEWECRFSGGCPAESWILRHADGNIDVDYLCGDCPFEAYINKLAEYEDVAEKIEDDGK